MKYVENFEAWALEKYNQFMKEKKSNPSFVEVVSPSNRTVTIINMKNRRASFSKCHDYDKFNTYIGYGVAWAKYIGEEIPKEIVVIKISELNPGQKFILANEVEAKGEFYYIGYNPVNNVSVAVHVNSGECYQFSMDRHVIKI